jgi:hypothetical protein
MTEKLLPCPFCGSTSLEILPEDPDSEGNAWGAVQCVNLDCPTYDGFRSHGVRVGDGQDVSDERGSDAYKSQAIAAWNRRIPAPEGEVVAWRLRRVGVVRWNLWDLDPRVDTPAYADAAEWEVRPLYASPVVPVGREEIARIIDPDVWANLGMRRRMGYDTERDTRSSLRKADAILAALGTKATDTGRVG